MARRKFAPHTIVKRWVDTDWAKSNKALAKELNVAETTVGAARKRYAPETIQNPQKRPPWLLVDWTRQTKDIANEFGVSCARVSQARKQFAPETLKFQSPPLSRTPFVEIEY